MVLSAEEVNVLDNDGLSDDEVPQEAHKSLLDAVSQLYKKQRIEAPKRREAAQDISEFNLSNKAEAKDNFVHVNDLLQDLQRKVTHKEIVKTVKEAQKKSESLPKPLEKNEAEKIQRALGYEDVIKKLNKWNTIVERNRIASQLTFPLQQKPMEKEPPNFISTFEKPTELEMAMAAVLNKSEVAKEERKVEDELSKLSIEQMIQRRNMMAKMRARESYQIAKGTRQNKIKSKKYHRILKKERIKKELQEFEKLQKTDPEAALNKLEQIERARAEERISLRHRNTGKWAKSRAVRAKYDTEARIQLAEQLAKSRELTRKVRKVDSSSEDEAVEEQVSEVEEERKTAEEDSGYSGNPWVKVYQKFLQGYQEFSQKKVENQPNLDSSNNCDKNVSMEKPAEAEVYSSPNALVANFMLKSGSNNEESIVTSSDIIDNSSTDKNEVNEETQEDHELLLSETTETSPKVSISPDLEKKTDDSVEAPPEMNDETLLKSNNFNNTVTSGENAICAPSMKPKSPLKTTQSQGVITKQSSKEISPAKSMSNFMNPQVAEGNNVLTSERVSIFSGPSDLDDSINDPENTSDASPVELKSPLKVNQKQKTPEKISPEKSMLNILDSQFVRKDTENNSVKQLSQQPEKSPSWGSQNREDGVKQTPEMISPEIFKSVKENMIEGLFRSPKILNSPFENLAIGENVFKQDSIDNMKKVQNTKGLENQDMREYGKSVGVPFDTHKIQRVLKKSLDHDMSSAKKEKSKKIAAKVKLHPSGEENENMYSNNVSVIYSASEDADGDSSPTLHKKLRVDEQEEIQTVVTLNSYKDQSILKKKSCEHHLSSTKKEKGKKRAIKLKSHPAGEENEGMPSNNVSLIIDSASDDVESLHAPQKKLKVEERGQIQTVVTNCGAWNVNGDGTSTERKAKKQKSLKKKPKQKTLTDMFDEAEEAIINHTQMAAGRIKSCLNNDHKEHKPKQSKRNPDKPPVKKQARLQDIDEALIEIHEEGISSGVNDIGQLKEKLMHTAPERNKEPQIDPSKYLNVKPQKLFSEVGDLIEEGDESDEEGTQRMHLMEAFADDDIADEFSKEKSEEAKKNKAEIISLEMPGWGSWGGTGVCVKSRRQRRRFIKLPKIPRKDDKMPTVIINEDPVPKLRQQLVSALPYPFRSVKDFEASIRAPLGKNWVPEIARKKITAPPVRTRMGTIIEPMADDLVAIKKKKRQRVK